MTLNEIYKKLLELEGIDRIQLTRAYYIGTNEGFNEKLITIITELQGNFNFTYYERLNNLCMCLDLAEDQNDIKKIDILNSQIKSHEKTLINPFLVSLRKDIEVYIHKTEPETIVIKDTLKAKKAKDYKDFIWFKTGLKLATGEAYDLYSKYKLDKGHFAKICFELGFKETDRTYFSSTINDNVTDKNTFADKDKLQKLHNYLTENNLPCGTAFLEKYNQIETE
jgi:hypothetical protein